MIMTFKIEIRAETGDSPKIKGYAAVFNQWSEDLGGFREIVKPGAFKKTIKEADVKALFNHDPNFVLGRNTSGTLALAEDSKGLAIEIDPPDTQWARDLVTSIDRGDIDQMSFGFRTVKDKWIDEKDEQLQRELLEVELYDVSPVTFPAYPQTTVGIRSIDMDKIQRIVLKAERNLPLSDEDKRVLDDTAKTIEALVKGDEDEDVSKPVEGNNLPRALKYHRIV